ncbi:hypothetical protein BD779DRAFT_1570830 [Infundibulicybe gibba]|nr:hypothetical protein BD779DRAFT_1570830 [Infundibulicybe gibba]
MLLSALTLPALLELDLVVCRAEWDIEMSAFFARSQPILRQLSLQMPHMEDRESGLLRILALTPHLRRLRLFDCLEDPLPFNAVLIRGLNPSPPSSAPLCPRLQRLHLSRVSDCPDGICAAMLRARWGAQAHPNGAACLEWAHIEFEGGVHDCDKTGMEDLSAEGLKGGIYLRHSGWHQGSWHHTSRVAAVMGEFGLGEV